MAPKRNPSACDSSSKPKRARVLLSLADKIKILDMLESGKSYTAVGREFGKNESSIREIYKAREKIRSSARVLPQASKATTVTRTKIMEKMESALFIWFQDLTKKSVPVGTDLLKQKALNIYELLASAPGAEPAKPFVASNGWLNRFKDRFGLKNVKLCGEAASADAEAASAFPDRLKEIIAEGGYHPKQVFNCDETSLFWKKMPTRTFVHQAVKSVPGKKAFKDRLTVLLCGNAAGQMIIPTVIYRSLNPRALKNKVKSHLPVFWMANRKAWITMVLFFQWFRQCFVPEAKKLMEKEGLPFKILLLLDNAPGHPETLCEEDPDVKVVFLPKNTTALLQPLDQGIIRCFKASYTRQVFEMIIAVLDAEPDADIMECYKNFNIKDAITFIRAAQDELLPQNNNACWRKIWSEAVNHFTGFPTVDADVTRILEMARRLGGDGMADMEETDIIEHIADPRVPLTDEELEDLIRSSPEDGEDATEDAPEHGDWSIDSLRDIIKQTQTLVATIEDKDPQLDRSSRVRKAILDGIGPLQELYRQLMREKSQAPITHYFPRVEKSTEPQPSTSSASDPQPSTSSAPDPQPSTSSAPDPQPSTSEASSDEEDPFPREVETIIWEESAAYDDDDADDPGVRADPLSSDSS